MACGFCGKIVEPAAASIMDAHERERNIRVGKLHRVPVKARETLIVPHIDVWFFCF